jgi:hypothetical protein
MVMTREELASALRHEVKILLHLASKVEPGMLDYRPTPKQRSMLELFRYMTIMGPGLVEVARTGTFDPKAWTALEQSSASYTFAEAVAALGRLRDQHTREITAMTDADMRAEIAPWGGTTTRGSFLVNLVLCGYTAYRMQVFLYLKACGRAELGTLNLWDGQDPKP